MHNHWRPPIPSKSFLIAGVLLAGMNLIALPQSAFAAQTMMDRFRERMSGGSNGSFIAPESNESQHSFTYQGLERTYLLHVPMGQPDGKALPLVLVFHGGGGNAENAARMSGMSAKADEAGFIAVYPNGTGTFKKRLLTWNTWNCCGYAKKNNIDDTGFVRALIEKLQREYSIDSKRIYVTGFSNGGMMSHKLGLELSDKIAAIAPVAGALNTETPQAKQPVSVIIFHGSEDQHVLYHGGEPRVKFDNEPRMDRPVSYAVDFWVKRNECNPVPQREEKGSVIKETYHGGKNGTEVVVYALLGYGHSWPGGKKGLRFGNIDEPDQDISATDLIWDFFAKHPK